MSLIVKVRMRKNTTQGKHAWMSVSRDTCYILDTLLCQRMLHVWEAPVGSTCRRLYVISIYNRFPTRRRADKLKCLGAMLIVFPKITD